MDMLELFVALSLVSIPVLTFAETFGDRNRTSHRD